MFNRHQSPLSITGEVGKAARQLRAALDQACIADYWVDAEVLERRHAMAKGCIVLLDLIMPGTFAERRTIIETIDLPVAPINPSDWLHDAAYIIPNHHFSNAELHDYLIMLKQMNRSVKCNFYDGCCCKEVRSKYPPSHKNITALWVKHRWSDAELRNFNR